MSPTSLTGGPENFHEPERLAQQEPGSQAAWERQGANSWKALEREGLSCPPPKPWAAWAGDLVVCRGGEGPAEESVNPTQTLTPGCMGPPRSPDGCQGKTRDLEQEGKAGGEAQGEELQTHAAGRGGSAWH